MTYSRSSERWLDWCLLRCAKWYRSYSLSSFSSFFPPSRWQIRAYLFKYFKKVLSSIVLGYHNWTGLLYRKYVYVMSSVNRSMCHFFFFEWKVPVTVHVGPATLKFVAWDKRNICEFMSELKFTLPWHNVSFWNKLLQNNVEVI